MTTYHHPQRKLACVSAHAFIAMLLFHPSMSALPSRIHQVLLVPFPKREDIENKNKNIATAIYVKIRPCDKEIFLILNFLG